MEKLKIGITIGDIQGIGPEIIIRALSNSRMLNLCTPIIYGSSKVLAYYKNIIKSENFNFNVISHPDQANAGKVNVINCWNETVNINPGQVNQDGGKYAYVAMDRALNDAKENKIQAIVTAPIHKQAMKMANFPFPGHTEFFTENLEVDHSLMMLVADEIRVALCTNHIPISEVANKINKKLIVKKIKILNDTLVKDFGIEKPTIAVLGLNPHAGDDGAIGSEDNDKVKPAIMEARRAGVLAMGPYSADGFFGSRQYQKFDAILASYHDQGLIPFKTLSFGKGVNYTAGLPIIRTSPDHGTAMDIAAKNEADHKSITQAIFLAIDLYRNRNAYSEDRKNPLKKKTKPSEKVEE